MYAKKYTYEDFDGNEITETFYFNFTELELMKLHNETEGGLDGFIKKMEAEQDVVKMQEFFQNLMDKSYGVRIDNNRFSKKPEYLDAFKESQAYSDLFFLFASDADEGAKFINQIMPKKLRQQAEAMAAQEKASIESN